jgi:hypothetical protein
MQHLEKRLVKSTYPAALATWLLLMLCALFSAWQCDVVIRTLAAVEAGRMILKPGVFLFLMLSLMTVLKLVCAIAWCVWAVRVTQNLRAIGVMSREQGPAELLWSWFVPILNWVTLYRGMSQLWSESVLVAEGTRDGSTTSRRPVLLISWLSVWIVHGIGIIATLVLDSEADQYIWLVYWLIRDAAMLVAAPLAAAMIFRISRMQARIGRWT